MIIRRAVSASVVFLLLMLILGDGTNSSTITVVEDDLVFAATDYIEHAPIAIESNEDLESQGWPGNGTVNNPYLIEGYSILHGSGSECIEISNTNLYVLIRNCDLSPYSVYLYDVANVTIEQCQMGRLSIMSSSNCLTFNNSINKYTEGLVYPGINLTGSENCSITINEITGGVGLYQQKCNDTVITDNIISYNGRGIYSSHSYYTSIIGNRIFSNGVFGIELSSESNSTIFGNYLGWNERNAKDDGTANQWDDGIGQGNYWSDYDSSGTYEITGDALSVDRYPSIWDEDFLGPDISCAYPGIMTWIDCYCTAPSYTVFTANITDMSGIDCVYFALNNGTYLNREWVNYTMEYSPTPSNPNRYIYNYTFDEIEVIFYIIAIDILGYYTQTSEYEVFIGIPASLPVPPYVDSLVIAAGIAFGVTLVVIVYWYKKSRSTR